MHKGPSTINPLTESAFHDVAINKICNPQKISMTIKVSKTDSFREGVNIKF